MSRHLLMLFAAFALVACTGGDASRVPDQTILVRDVNGAPMTPALSPDGSRLAWAQVVGGQARIFVGGADASNPVMLTEGTWDIDPKWSPDGQWIAYYGESPGFDVWVVPAGGGESRQLTSGPARDQPVGWLADNSGIVFYRRGAGEVQTLVAPVDGGPLRLLIPHRGGNQFALPSPDGSRVAFEIWRGSASTIWVADADGGNARQLTTEGLEAASPLSSAWSPDGQQLVYTSRRTGTGDIWTANLETGELRQITTDIRNDFGHRWSPDGRWIAFLSNRGGQDDIWVVSAMGGEAIRVTDDLSFENDISWSLDGGSITFSRAVLDGQVGVSDPNGESRVLVEWTGYVIDPDIALSPDEQTVLFASNRSGSWDIWSVPLSGGEAVPFAASPLNDDRPAFSPDGSQVLFESNRSGSRDLYVVAAAGGEPRRLTEWSGNERTAAWSPDGSQVAFFSDHEATQGDLWVVAASGGTPRRLTTLDQGITGFPQWSPDGTSIFVMSNSSDGAALYRVPAAGGRPQRLTIASTTAGWGGVLSPDGSSYAYSAVERGWSFLEVVPTTGGAPRRIAPRDERVWNTRGIWSRDGTRIAIADWQFDDDGTENVVEYSLDGSAPRELTSRPASYEVPGAYTSDGRLVYAAQGVASTIVRVSVAELLAGK